MVAMSHRPSASVEFRNVVKRYGEVFAVDRRVIGAIAPGTAVRVEFAAHGLALVPEGKIGEA
jgi:hypothetical protein